MTKLFDDYLERDAVERFHHLSSLLQKSSLSINRILEKGRGKGLDSNMDSLIKELCSVNLFVKFMISKGDINSKSIEIYSQNFQKGRHSLNYNDLDSYIDEMLNEKKTY